jgi:hypothetical protein
MAFGLSLDDDEEDFEDAMEMAEQASNNEFFSRAYGALEEAKSLGINDSAVADLEKRIDQQKSRYDARIERQRQERLARERAVRQSASSGDSSSGFRGISKDKCYRISEHAPMQVCLRGLKIDSCGILKSYPLQQVCRYGTYGNCASFGYSMRKVCEQGVRSSACDGISDYNKRKSCQSFSGSTEFWLILSSYGYYTW